MFGEILREVPMEIFARHNHVFVRMSPLAHETVSARLMLFISQGMLTDMGSGAQCTASSSQKYNKSFFIVT